MKSIRRLEIHLIHSCNLSCESCSHYSNQGHKGSLSLAEAERWMNLWSQRFSPHTFSLLGGEPTIHPDLAGFVALSRRHWPAAHLRLVTNGFFLHRHPALPAVLQRDPNACIYLSIHHDAPEYLEKLRPIVELLGGWVRDYGIRVEFFKSFKRWTRRYHGFGSAMEPFKDGQPRQSWEHCPAKYCPQLFEGKIWKCAPLAYLKLQNAKYQLSDSWKPYLQYQPLEPGCTDEQLAEFFSREEEPACNMCPANPTKFKLPIPLNSSSTRIAVGV
jgi:Radical SAM superfamily/4Fe-4S single cluster domain